jgi:hypothetical protein
VAPDTVNETEVIGLVSQNAGLESKLYEFKKEIGNGTSVLEASGRALLGWSGWIRRSTTD